MSVEAIAEEELQLAARTKELTYEVGWRCVPASWLSEHWQLGKVWLMPLQGCAQDNSRICQCPGGGLGTTSGSSDPEAVGSCCIHATKLGQGAKSASACVLDGMVACS